jgi:hypothetical protein
MHDFSFYILIIVYLVPLHVLYMPDDEKLLHKSFGGWFTCLKVFFEHGGISSLSFSDVSGQIANFLFKLLPYQ